METPSSAETFWDREVVDPTHTSWMQNPRVADYILQSISGSERGLWPVDWFERWLSGRRFKRGLSIGCGTGPLERDVVRRGLVEKIDAFDGSTNSLRVAREAAVAEGLLPRIRYYAADFNRPSLPKKLYDVVFVHQALHHVTRLERLMSAIMEALTEDGILYLDEYIGPSRTQWNEKRIRRHRAIFESTPGEAKLSDTLLLPVQKYDPSEAVRSAEIMPRLRVGFDIKAVRGYGGNLLSVLCPLIDFDRTPGGVDAIIREEKQLLATGEPPFYAVIVARPKKGDEAGRAISTYAVLDLTSHVQRTLTPPWLRELAFRAKRKFFRVILRRKP